MRFKRPAKLQDNFEHIPIVPLVNVIFLVLVFFMLTSSFAFQSGIRVKLPRAITGEFIKEENLTITITGEDIVYINKELTTIKELRKELTKPQYQGRPLLIKADRRASVGRIVDIWNLCRDLGIERINIATN